MFTKKNNKKLSNEEEEKIQDEFKSFQDTEYSEDDVNKILNNEENILKKILSDENLKKFIEEVRLFFNMLKDFFSRNYTDVPIGTILAIIGTLLYVLAPLDIVPDFIPIVGYLDDAGMIAVCLKAIKIDIDKYKITKGI